MTEKSYRLTVLDVITETVDARTIVLDPGDHVAEFAYKPGQFLTVGIPSDQTGIAARCYSFSSSPHSGGPLAITVKRTVDGFASGWITSQLKVGDTLQVLPPSGIFTPASLDADLLLFAGGSGVTPIISIARTAMASGTGRVVVFYANRDQDSVIFGREWTELAATHPDRLLVVHWLESVQGLPSQAQLKAFAAQYSDFDAFVCGPAPFMKATVEALKELGFPRERRHQEKFVSLGGNPFGDSTPSPAAAEAAAATAAASGLTGPVSLEVDLDGTTYSFDDWDPGTTMLRHLESKGVPAPYSCEEGECSACAFRIISGEVELLKNDILDADDLAEGIRLACQAVPTTPSVKATYS